MNMEYMNREYIMCMGRQAGYGDVTAELHAPTLERFAALVAAAEREACVSIITREAQAYSEPVWAVEIVNDIRARGEK